MNRMEEYNAVIAELEQTPPALEYAFCRAQDRIKNSRRQSRLFAVPLSSLAVFFIVFVVMVNVSTPFALACGRVPLLRKLAAAVAFSPSLSAAVDNEYVQPINLTQTDHGNTMRIEYVIVDQKQLNVFYTLNSETHSELDAVHSIGSADGASLEGFSISSGSYGVQNGELRHFTVDFMERDMPQSLILKSRVFKRGGGAADDTKPVKSDLFSEPAEHDEPEYISAYTFTLTFDPAFTQQGEVIGLNQSLVLDGQKLTATTVEVYPTHIRLNLKDSADNTAWLKSLMYYLEDEKGGRFEQISNGITATGSADSPMMCSHRLESSFFSGSGQLTLTITGAVWLDKAMERVRVDLKNGLADALPEGVTLKKAARKNSGWELTFSGVQRTENACHQLFSQNYYDEKGNEYEYNSWLTGISGFWDEDEKKYVELPGTFCEQFALADYPYDAVYLAPAYSRAVTFDTPVVIRIK